MDPKQTLLNKIIHLFSALSFVLQHIHFDPGTHKYQGTYI